VWKREYFEKKKKKKKKKEKACGGPDKKHAHGGILHAR